MGNQIDKQDENASASSDQSNTTDEDIKSAPPEMMTVRILDGNSYEVPYEADATVLKVKQTIEEKLGMPADDLKIIGAAKILDNEKTLAQCDMKAGCELIVIFKMTKKGRNILYIETLMQTYIIVDYIPNDTIAKLKYKIAEKSGHNLQLLRLVYNGKSLLDDEATLESCGVKKEDCISLIVSQTIQNKHKRRWSAPAFFKKT